MFIYAAAMVCSAVILCICYLLEPCRIDAIVVRLLHCKMNHGVFRGCAVPAP